MRKDKKSMQALDGQDGMMRWTSESWEVPLAGYDWIVHTPTFFSSCLARWDDGGMPRYVSPLLLQFTSSWPLRTAHPEFCNNQRKFPAVNKSSATWAALKSALKTIQTRVNSWHTNRDPECRGQSTKSHLKHIHCLIMFLHWPPLFFLHTTAVLTCAWQFLKEEYLPNRRRPMTNLKLIIGAAAAPLH